VFLLNNRTRLGEIPGCYSSREGWRMSSSSARDITGRRPHSGTAKLFVLAGPTQESRRGTLQWELPTVAKRNRQRIFAEEPEAGLPSEGTGGLNLLGDPSSVYPDCAGSLPWSGVQRAGRLTAGVMFPLMLGVNQCPS
jgi:hypothetical protein